jgi:Arc/MetJ-type ribon-helix-helix transcriptional regulator
MSEINFGPIWERIRHELKDKGIDLDVGCCDTDPGSPLKIVCMAGGLSDSLKEMGKTTRDQVVMVRVDEDTSRKLDHWVETGAFKSRSEAAALFMREGLAVHARELDELHEAIDGMKQARENLRRKAREIFASEADEPDEG